MTNIIKFCKFVDRYGEIIIDLLAKIIVVL